MGASGAGSQETADCQRRRPHSNRITRSTIGDPTTELLSIKLFVRDGSFACKAPSKYEHAARRNESVIGVIGRAGRVEHAQTPHAVAATAVQYRQPRNPAAEPGGDCGDPLWEATR